MGERHDENAVTREALIDLCRRGVVPESEWLDRDSSGAQKQLGEALALLSAGCEFTPSSDPTSTDDTWWIEITYRGFGHFDWGGDLETDLFYIPTAKRLERRDGDWY